ncbi:BQ2448_6697 [Microbotryum intermedium]|uniref:BQ2448_6697 protein n=1 Tax=Microbotryum intermedium TaxID=269621 RepID=A0A238FM76_9BASI|nr:BQ2448_6697 [Microbotryum intermedium]
MATLERPRSSATNDASYSKTPIRASFDPFAVPRAPSAAELDLGALRLRAESSADQTVEHVHDPNEPDLIELGQERLFSGARTATMRDLAAPQPPLPPTAIHCGAPAVGTPTAVSEASHRSSSCKESFGQLGAAKLAFLSALQGLLQPLLRTSTGEMATLQAMHSSGSTPIASTSMPSPQDSARSDSRPSPSQAPAAQAPADDELLARLILGLRVQAMADSQAGANVEDQICSPSSLGSPLPGSASTPVIRLALANELQARIERLAPALSPNDASLARNLGALIASIERLINIGYNLMAPVPLPTDPATRPTPASASLTTDLGAELSASGVYSSNVYQRLARVAKALQQSKNHGPSQDTVHALSSVFGAAREVERAERDLLWGRIDDLSERVRTLCRERTEALFAEDQSAIVSAGDDQSVPDNAQSSLRSSTMFGPSISSVTGDLPSYSHDPNNVESENPHLPPSYFADHVPNSRTELGADRESAPLTHQISHRGNEKMQRELDSVSHAIERLYAVSPQLANQRVEPDRRAVRERQLAKLGNAIERLSKGRLDDQRAVSVALADEDPGEKAARNQRIQEVMLDKLIDQINRAASRTLTDQRADVNGGKHREFVRSSSPFVLSDPGEAARREFILEHTGKGRLASQDAVLQSHYPVETFPGPPLSGSLFAADYSLDGSPPVDGPSLKKRFSNLRLSMFKRPGSLSASRRPSYDSRLDALLETTPSSPMSRRGSADPAARRASFESTGLGLLGLGNALRRPVCAFDALAPPVIDYIVEEARNLGSLVVSFWPRLPGSARQGWEVKSFEGESIFVAPTVGGAPSRVVLPSRVATQVAPVISRGSYFEIKLAAFEPSPTRSRPDLEIHSPLSTAELRDSLPRSFACSTCHSEVVDTSAISKYNALPSEHWAELLDAWMCHQDQTLSDDLIAKGKGIQPRAGEGMVGSSYLLFDRALAKNWHRMPLTGEPEQTESGDTLYPAQCDSCSSMIGFEVAPAQASDTSTRCFRLHKFATYPISLRAPGSPLKDAPRYSLAIHITAELLELGQAHACHRFIVEDREHDKARLLLWLFNPSVRLSFSVMTTPGVEVLEDSSRQPSPTFPGAAPVTKRSMNAVKVFFIVVENEADEECQEFIASPMSTCERTQYPLSIITRLTELLRASSSIYPSDKRRWGQLEVGFLERL